MKMIDVLIKLANGEIKDGSILKVVNEYDELYGYKYHKIYRGFKSETGDGIEEHFFLDKDFLNFNVELIPPKEKKYLVKFNMRGLRNGREYLNLDYDKRGDERVHLNDKCETLSMQTEFTKSELQSIQSVREFLEDVEGKYELIEVEENEID